MSRLTLGSIALGLVVAVAAPAAAQEWVGRGRLVVLVKSATTQEPVVGAKVTAALAEDTSVTPGLDWRTDKKGKLSYLGLKGATWLVRIEADGFKTWTGPIEVFSQGMPETLVAILTPEDPAVLEAQRQAKAAEVMQGVSSSAAAKLAAGDLDGARADYEQALGLLEPPQQPRVLMSLADIAMRQGRLADAKTLLDRALAIDPGYVSALRTKASILASEGNMAEAEALLSKLPQDAEVHPVTLLNLAMAHYNKGELADAKSHLDQAIGQHPEIGIAYYYRGLVDLSLSDNATALADFERYMTLEPGGDKRAEVEEYLKYLRGATAPK
jgi:Tfp pilus assembly protein PilF